jgi:hypothetical protein
VGQCPLSCFFFKAHRACITAHGRSCLGMTVEACRRYIHHKPRDTPAVAKPIEALWTCCETPYAGRPGLK